MIFLSFETFYKYDILHLEYAKSVAMHFSAEVIEEQIF
jgi:hypothetical protein